MSQLLVAQRALTVPGWAKDALWRRAQAIPSLDLRFADSKSLVDATTGSNLVTFTRASSGTFVGSDGVIKTATNDAPRFDHNPTTGESLGLLVEEQRANLLLRSEEFDNASWILGAATVTPNAVAAPNGSSTADQLVETTATANHEASQSFTPIANTSYTFSCYLKAATSSTCGLRVSANLTGSGVICSVDLSAKTATVTSGTGTATITTLADGWFRVSLTATASASPSSTFAYVFRSLGSTGSTSNSVYLWGAQLEAGAFPTSYIPTTTATVTRSADVCSITGSAFSSWYRQDEGSFYGEFARSAVDTRFPATFTVSDNTRQNEIYSVTGQNGSAQGQFSVTTGNVSQAYLTVTALTAPAANKVAGAFKSNDFIVAANGALSAADTSGTVPTVDRAYIGLRGDGVSSINGTIRRLTFWGQRLPNNVLQKITQ